MNQQASFAEYASSNSVLDLQYAEHFGFIQDEVDEMLKYYGLEEQREKIKEWYDGYRFGVQDIYITRGVF